MPTYLSRYVGAGTDADPFRPLGSDQPGWSSVDLRPDGGATLDGGGLNACLLEVPEPDPRLFALGELAEPVVGARLRELNARLRLAVPAGLLLREALIRIVSQPPAHGWAPLDALWLGRMLWTAPGARRDIPTLFATFTDDFNRADNADLGANWDPSATDVDRHCQIVGAQAWPGNGNVPCYESVNSISPGGAQFATITIGALIVADSQVGATIRATVGSLRNFYQAATDSNGAGTTTALTKRVSGSSTSLATENATSWATGNTLKLGGNGSTITVQRNGAGTLLTATDSAHTAGRVGIYCFENTGSASIETFDGGDIATATVVPQAAMHYARQRS